MYHTCLACIFEPLRPAMTLPEVVRCPDGHFRRAIYSLGPYIADYPEQVWLAGIVQGWCPKYVSALILKSIPSSGNLIFRCEASPDDEACIISHLLMDFRVLISTPFYHPIYFTNSSKVPLRITW